MPFPDDFALTEPRRQFARDKGLDDRRIDVQWERFRNHAEQNERRCKVWDAAWRNWVLTDVERNGIAANGHKPLPWNSAKRRQPVIG